MHQRLACLCAPPITPAWGLACSRRSTTFGHFIDSIAFCRLQVHNCNTVNAFFLLSSGYTAPPYTVIKCAFFLALPIASGTPSSGQISLIFWRDRSV